MNNLLRRSLAVVLLSLYAIIPIHHATASSVLAPGQMPLGIRATRPVYWGSGWSHFMPFSVDSADYMLIYNKNTGDVHFDKIDLPSQSIITVWAEKWAPGWTNFTPFVMSGNVYFIAYNATTGDVHFDQINSYARGMTIRWMGRWSSGWSHFIPFSLSGQNHLIAYNSTTGLAHIDRISSVLSGTYTVTELRWSTGFKEMLGYSIGSTNYLLAYNPNTGLAHFDLIDPSLNGVQVLQEVYWSPNWKLAQMAVEGIPFLLAYNATSGLVHFDRLNGGGMTITVVSNWQPGKTNLVGVNLMSTSSSSGAPSLGALFSYDSVSGFRALDLMTAVGTSHLSCTSDSCRLRQVPVLLQSDPKLPADVAAAGPFGCYDTSIAMVIAGALHNRRVFPQTEILRNRTADYYRVMLSGNPVDLTAFQYRTAAAGDPFYIIESVNDLGGVTALFPSGCNPRVYSKCTGIESHYGDAFSVWIDDRTWLDSGTFIAALKQKTIFILAFNWSTVSASGGGVLTYSDGGFHKVSIVGFKTDGDPYPLIIHDPGSGVVAQIRVGTLQSSASLILPNGASQRPYLEYKGSSAKYLLDHYDGMRLF